MTALVAQSGGTAGPVAVPAIVPRAAAVGAPGPHFKDYSQRLSQALLGFDWAPVERLADDILGCWRYGRQVFMCGNGGSAGNANHLANDFIYALSRRKGSGVRVHALSANPAILTCLANDEGYDSVFSHQLAVQADKGDILHRVFGLGQLAEYSKGAGRSAQHGREELCCARLQRRQGEGARRRADPFRRRRHADRRGHADHHRPHDRAVALCPARQRSKVG